MFAQVLMNRLFCVYLYFNGGQVVKLVFNELCIYKLVNSCKLCCYLSMIGAL